MQETSIIYSKLSDSSMFDKYQKEHDHFKYELYTEEYKPMWDYMESILK